MFRRNRFGITAALLCHLVLASSVVTSQLLPAARPDSPPASSPQQAPPSPQAGPGSWEPVTIKARQQEKTGDVYKLHGDAEVYYRKWVLRADEATYDDATGEVIATGHLTLDGGPHDEHIVATHGRYNVRSETGTFYDVVGTTGLRLQGNKAVLTSSNPFAYTGKVVDKLGPNITSSTTVP